MARYSRDWHIATSYRHGLSSATVPNTDIKRNTKRRYLATFAVFGVTSGKVHLHIVRKQDFTVHGLMNSVTVISYS